MTPEGEVARAARALGSESEWHSYFGHHSRSFRFSAWLFPREPRRDIAGIYAYCRFTDDLVDEAEVPAERARDRLAAWAELSRAAYDGEETGIPLLDTVLPRMAEAEAPYHYVEELLAGVEMDLSPLHFETLEDLEVYTYRVASVVGGWITEQFGLHDRELLQRAFSMGHAMQLTNILRDVGEDWRRERLYLPRRMLARYRVGPEVLDRTVRRGPPVPAAWADLVESLMLVADHHYDRAFEALPELPGWYARPVAVATRVYQGIHDEIRANDYDNLTRRAWTSLWTKVKLGAGGLTGLRRARSRHVAGESAPMLAGHDR